MICVKNQIIGLLEFAYYESEEEMNNHMKEMESMGWTVIDNYFDLHDGKAIQVLVYQKKLGKVREVVNPAD